MRTRSFVILKHKKRKADNHEPSFKMKAKMTNGIDTNSSTL